ncbi:serine hydrolase [Massilia sp. H6]|uniref:serine hydrolase domain-containing protein n=1 Tax=Massilia sp. H6 TaxID=2970464 RepID=UPI0021684831|nr:serine hydrolase domain-containing protein [Massilia sp. H6]UVW27200.1 beta-lactamase family protein [Massilia sp. H6]
MRRTCLALLLTAVLAGPAQADRLDDALLAEMKRRQVPGLSVLVLKDGKVIKEKGYGLANVEHAVPVTPQTVFQSGSVGKTFTAALILLLERDGKLSLDDPLSRHLPGTPPAWDKITLRHLLSHTSGLGDPYEIIDLRKDYSDEELMALEARVPMRFSPGEKWSYSNMGYHLLGFVANRVGGKFYGEQLRERLFAPLGMGTRVISESDIIPHRAAGYERKDGVLKNQAWVAPRLNTTADGSLYLTARDLARWDQALYGDAILDARLRQASFTPAKLNDGSDAPYGYGWYVDKVKGRRHISHGGAWQGFRAHLCRYVDDKLTVIILANADSAPPSRFANMVAAHYVPDLFDAPAKAIADPEPALTAQVRAAMAGLAAGQAPAGANDELAAKLTPAVLARVAEALREAGTLRSVGLLSRKDDAAGRRLRYRFEHDTETLLVSITLDQGGRFAALNFSPE